MRFCKIGVLKAAAICVGKGKVKERLKIWGGGGSCVLSIGLFGLDKVTRMPPNTIVINVVEKMTFFSLKPCAKGGKKR